MVTDTYDKDLDKDEPAAKGSGDAANTATINNPNRTPTPGAGVDFVFLRSLVDNIRRNEPYYNRLKGDLFERGYTSDQVEQNLDAIGAHADHEHGKRTGAVGEGEGLSPSQVGAPRGRGVRAGTGAFPSSQAQKDASNAEVPGVTENTGHEPNVDVRKNAGDAQREKDMETRGHKGPAARYK